MAKLGVVSVFHDHLRLCYYERAKVDHNNVYATVVASQQQRAAISIGREGRGLHGET